MYTTLKVQKRVSRTAERDGGCQCSACTNVQPIQSDIYSSISTEISQNKVSMYHLFIYLSLCRLPTFRNYVRVNYLVFLLLFRVWAQALLVII
jgi:hypothetical protein